MIHSPDIIDQIRSLIKLSGVNNEAIIEEMVDHYLSEIEFSVSEGIQDQKAIRNVYQSIANTDLKVLEPAVYTREKWVAGIALLTLVISLLIFTWNKSQDKIPTMIANQKAPISSIISPPSAWPLKAKKLDIASEFGMRYHPILQTKKFHKGIDIRAKKGTPVLSTGNGVAQKVGYNSSSGNFIIIKHNDIFSTRYTHLLNVNIKTGDQVNLGSKIGEVGNSGMSLGPHLHYEIIKNNEVIDPLKIVRP